MRSLLKFAYAAALLFSVFATQPTPAAAEGARGTFTLAHEVHWKNCVLHSGEYAFSVKTMGASEFLVLQSLTGERVDAMLLVNDVDTPKPDESSRLVLVSRDGQSFVSEVTLPEYEKTLHFNVPAESASK